MDFKRHIACLLWRCAPLLLVVSEQHVQMSEAMPLVALARRHTVAPEQKPETAAPRPLSLLIDFHQRVISPADGPRSHYFPVSSTYARGALRRFGWRGLALVFDRLMRENSEIWHYTIDVRGGSAVKLDPVPLAAQRFAFFPADAMGEVSR